ncbi:hypothetical protein CTI14_00705 [Methylobacterium radiotolerans]|nr:hypothetical protein CTI14_00705 [Methylobacterium radiotolerans]
MSTIAQSVDRDEGPRVDTVSWAIYALVDQAYRDGSHRRFDDAITRLASLAMNATDLLNPFILALDERLDKGDYSGALLVARAMVTHEDNLMRSTAGRADQQASERH